MDIWEQAFDDFLNECYEPYEIGGITILPATALKECDPIAYRQALLDWEDLNEREREDN
jgi:hypothetical protein